MSLASLSRTMEISPSAFHYHPVLFPALFECKNMRSSALDFFLRIVSQLIILQPTPK